MKMDDIINVPDDQDPSRSQEEDLAGSVAANTSANPSEPLDAMKEADGDIKELLAESMSNDEVSTEDVIIKAEPPSTKDQEPRGEAEARIEEEYVEEEVEDKEEGFRAEEGIRAEEVNANTAYVIGQVNIGNDAGKSTPTDKPQLVDVSPEVWRKIEAVFVPSQGYTIFLEGNSRPPEQRVFIVHGDKHAGKFTCAIHLGLDLFEGESPEFKVYKRSARDAELLIDFVQRDLPQKSIVIIEHAFESGIDFSELSASSPYISAICKTLEDKGNYLLLTTTSSVRKLEELPVPQVSADVHDQLPLILTNHLERYNGYTEEAHISDSLVERVQEPENQNKVLSNFQWPFQIDLFCRRLGRLSSEEESERILAIATEIGRIGKESPDEWFNQLSANERLYAMLVGLFPGIDQHLLNEIYEIVVKSLREDGVDSLDDPREVGLNDILERLHAGRTEVGSVRFTDLSLAREVRRQIDNYHYLLWSFIRLPLLLTEQFSAPEYWELRKSLGAAMGRLGIRHQEKLWHGVLNPLAKHDHGGVVAVAGYALDEICRSGSHFYHFVVNVLDGWATSEDPDLMWAVGASIWRIYDGLARSARGNGETQHAERSSQTLEEVQDILTYLAQNFDRFGEEARNNALVKVLGNEVFESVLQSRDIIAPRVARELQRQLEIWARNNVRSILHAIRRMAMRNSEDVVIIISRWLDSEESNLQDLGKMAGRQLFEESTDPELLLIEERHAPLLGLIEPLLATDSKTIDPVTRTLVVWLQQSREWAERIHTTLLRIINHTTPEKAERLRESLSHEWLDNDVPEARRIGNSLVARAYAMSGIPLDMPGRRYGLIAMDASRNARMSRIGATAARKLYARLDSQLDMYVVHMGERRRLARPGEFPSSADLQTEYDKPRLLMPPLEGFDPDYSLLTLVISLGQVVDIEDIIMTSWLERLIVATPKGVNLSKKFSTVSIEPTIGSTSLTRVEEAAREQLAQVLVDLKPEDWWGSLQVCFECGSDAYETIVSRLDKWIEELDSVKSCGCCQDDTFSLPWKDATVELPCDNARVIVCTILWMAAIDFPRCVETISRWLSDSRPLFRLMGTACAKTLFRMYAHRSDTLSSHRAILALAPLMIQAHENYQAKWSAAEAVLYAAQRWGRRPDWSARLVATPEGEPSELVTLIDEILPEAKTDLTQKIKQWQEGIDEEKVPEPLMRLIELLKFRIVINTHEPLPELPVGHSYGLIVFDSTEKNNRSRKYFAELARDVFERLQGESAATLHMLFYRLGQSYPIAGSKQDTVDIETLAASDMNARPRLLLPLLENLRDDQVNFVLVITETLILDEMDLQNTSWIDRVRIYGTRDASRVFRVIPGQAHEDLSRAEARIIRHLTVEGE